MSGSGNFIYLFIFTGVLLHCFLVSASPGVIQYCMHSMISGSGGGVYRADLVVIMEFL